MTDVGIGLSTLVNILDYSAAVLPVTVVDKNIDIVVPGYQALNPLDKKIYLNCEYIRPV
jgi:amidase